MHTKPLYAAFDLAVETPRPLWLYGPSYGGPRRSKRKGRGHKQHARAQARVNRRRRHA